MAKLKLHDDKTNPYATLKLINVRLSYPYLKEARPKEKGEEDRPDKWEASFIVDKTMGSPFKENITDLKKALNFVKEKAFDGRKVPVMVHSNKKKDKPGYEDKEGYYLCAPSYKKKPLILDKKKDERMDAPESMFYAGARVHAVIRVYPQRAKGKGTANRVACSLEGVQFVDHDDRIDSSDPIEADEWFDLEGDDAEGGDGDWEDEGSEEEEEDFTL